MVEVFMTNFLMFLATVGITLALGIAAISPEKHDVIASSAIVGVIAMVLAFIQHHRDEIKDDQKHNELISVLKAIAKQMGVDVDKRG